MACYSTEGFIRSESVLVECLGYLIYRLLSSTKKKPDFPISSFNPLYSILLLL